LAAEIPLEPILDSIADGLERCLSGVEESSTEALASACWLLAANGHSHSGLEWMRTLGSIAAEDHLQRLIFRSRLCDLVVFIALLENTPLQDRFVHRARTDMGSVASESLERRVAPAGLLSRGRSTR
jgi:hypothetical protein